MSGRRRATGVPALVSMLAVLAVPASPAAAAVHFGVRAGAYLDEPDPFAGIELLAELGSTGWYFNPNIELAFGDERDRLSANLDFHYDFGTTGKQYVWAGLGPAIIHTEFDRGGDETDVGLNLLAGIGWRWQGTTPYAQVKIVISDDSEVVAGVGIRF